MYCAMAIMSYRICNFRMCCNLWLLSVLMGLMIDRCIWWPYTLYTHQLTGAGKMRTERRPACGLHRYWLRYVQLQRDVNRMRFTYNDIPADDPHSKHVFYGIIAKLIHWYSLTLLMDLREFAHWCIALFLSCGYIAYMDAVIEQIPAQMSLELAVHYFLLVIKTF